MSQVTFTNHKNQCQLQGWATDASKVLKPTLFFSGGMPQMKSECEN